MGARRQGHGFYGSYLQKTITQAKKFPEGLDFLDIKRYISSQIPANNSIGKCHSKHPDAPTARD